jgi:hypothetical protein
MSTDIDLNDLKLYIMSNYASEPFYKLRTWINRYLHSKGMRYERPTTDYLIRQMKTVTLVLKTNGKIRKFSQKVWEVIR